MGKREGLAKFEEQTELPGPKLLRNDVQPLQRNHLLLRELLLRHGSSATHQQQARRKRKTWTCSTMEGGAFQ